MQPITLLLGPPHGGPSGSRVSNQRKIDLVQTVYPGSIAARDLNLFLFGTVFQNIVDYLPASWKGGFDMGII